MQLAIKKILKYDKNKESSWEYISSGLFHLYIYIYIA
jgi:hypothetical protein